ncbi:YciI family protein [Aquimarina gracilis]|uniref:YciI family protein n=1 Tax=Aquimarina gracilis TaxID=874422 RepID=A0ABU5ZYK1_9FLAO|nr:YciI family protein [Aquimarina gracilis]MEB3346977.1 YciI family protein [Aquimarina gracilis]
MKEFMFLFKGGDDAWDAKSPKEQEEHMQLWQQWIGELAEQEKFIGGERLYTHGNTIHPGEMKVTDRPLAEGKELVGGYLVVKADSINEATEMAKGCPGLQWETSVEVREVWPES